MKAGLHISRFTYPGGAEAIAPTLIRIVKTAEDVGFSRLDVMDHYFQIEFVGKKEEPMMEAYTTLSFIAAQTKKVKLGAMVTGVVYRQPAFLVNQVTALDVLSGGRAFLGIGAAWNEVEAKGLGFPFPPVKERFKRLEETLEIALQMWKGDTAPFEGTYYHLEHPLNSPQPLSKPHPPILIGGGGEQKTLLLVAKYANACNLFGALGTNALQHKLDVLKKHCEEVGRNYDEIEKTVMLRVDFSNGDTPESVSKQCESFANLGFEEVIFTVAKMEMIKPLETIGKHVLPAIAAL